MSAPLEIVYGRRPVREVLRAGRRAITRVSVTERALEAEGWLRET
ncbi:MAG: RNA methyltransferase substrate-binding domain-containing protein, partial [Gaiellales bacterium]